MITFILPSTGKTVGLIGDPHLGKDFDKHAPRSRKGERAMRQMAKFNEELSANVDIVVMVGDLFDHPMVSRGIVVGAAHAVRFQAEAWPDKTFIMMAGNHDVPRNLSSVGAWPIFTKMLEDRYPNLHVVRRPQVIEKIALFPWEWDRTALEQLEDVGGHEADAAVGHWDLELFDGDGDHMAPTKALEEAFGEQIALYSGHFHTPGVYTVDGIDVECTGSMQPISHGEDPGELFYVTRPLEEVLSNPEAYRDKHVRVIVKPGEEVPDLDCLAVTHLRVREDEEQQVTLSPENFDWTARLAERILKLPVKVQDFIIERMPDADPKKQRRSGAGASSQGSAMGDSSSPSSEQSQPLG